jgi:hypothetical protein
MGNTSTLVVGKISDFLKGIESHVKMDLSHEETICMVLKSVEEQSK